MSALQVPPTIANAGAEAAEVTKVMPIFDETKTLAMPEKKKTRTASGNGLRD